MKPKWNRFLVIFPPACDPNNAAAYPFEVDLASSGDPGIADVECTSRATYFGMAGLILMKLKEGGWQDRSTGDSVLVLWLS
jgi:hypothetical protein